MKHSVGDKVELHREGIPGFGSLNKIFLSEEGYFGGFLEILNVDEDDRSYVVELPTGYKLKITNRDIVA